MSNKLALTFFAIIFSTCSLASPHIIYKEVDDTVKTFSASKLPSSINHLIQDIESRRKNIYKVVVYKFSDHYVLNLLSSTEWKTTKIRVDLNATGNIIRHDDAYTGSASEAKTLMKMSSFTPVYDGNHELCPDSSVEFVAISPVPELGRVREAIEEVYQSASKHYKTIKILGEDANAKAYYRWLTCPRLKGFYSIGHGSNTDLLVANDEIIPYIIFHDERFSLKYIESDTMLIFNSCEVFNIPFGSEITFGNAHRESDYHMNPGPTPGFFMSGYISLPIGDSEKTSACFITKVLEGAEKNYTTLKNCVEDEADFYYRGFGMSFPRKNYLEDM